MEVHIFLRRSDGLGHVVTAVDVSDGSFFRQGIGTMDTGALIGELRIRWVAG